MIEYSIEFLIRRVRIGHTKISIIFWKISECDKEYRYLGSTPGRVKPTTIQLVFVAFPLSTKH